MVHLPASASRRRSGAAPSGRLGSAAFAPPALRPAWSRCCRSPAVSVPLPDVHRRSTRTGSLTR
eukprot:5056277-Alexandrium_andersonii.AAC.1